MADWQSGASADPPVWTYVVGHQTHGPLTRAQLAAAAYAGRLPPQTPLFNVQTQQHLPAGAVIPYAQHNEPPAPRAGDDPGMRMLLPVGRSGWAIAAGYLGLMGWLIWPLAPIALVTAELGRRQIRRDPSKHGMGRVTLGFIGGIIGTIPLLFILWSIATDPA